MQRKVHQLYKQQSTPCTKKQEEVRPKAAQTRLAPSRHLVQVLKYLITAAASCMEKAQLLYSLQVWTSEGLTCRPSHAHQAITNRNLFKTRQCQYNFVFVINRPL